MTTVSKPKVYSAVAPKRCIKILMGQIRVIETIADELLEHLNDVYGQRIRDEFGEKTVFVLSEPQQIHGTLRDCILESQQSILVFAGQEDIVKSVQYDLLHAQQRGVSIRIFVPNSTELVLEPVYRVQAPLPNIFIYDERSLMWFVTPSFALYSRCPLCANEVIKFCSLTAQKILSTLQI